MAAVALARAESIAPGRAQVASASNTLQFVFTSDAHYGLTRAFRGGTDVSAHVVNAAMVARINAISGATFPKDGGVRSAEPIGPVDFVVQGGDIANREEGTGPTAIQSAATSWAQFRADYIDGITVKSPDGRRAPLFIVPGNHDVSNAIGFYNAMTPSVDKTSMMEIYNWMMAPSTSKTSATYDYPRDKVLVSHDIDGVHFMFITMWPDSGVRAWMSQDLARVSPTTPVIVFTHDQPDSEAKHFTNPNGAHDINARDKFENLLADQLADGPTVAAPTTIEQGAFERFLQQHPNVTAYFHGNSNWNQFYDWTGPGHSIVLHTFRVDSPMKGALSSKDETALSFQVATMDLASRTITVRECLWNADPAHPAAPLAWGGSTTVALSPRPAGSAIANRR